MKKNVNIRHPPIVDERPVDDNTPSQKYNQTSDYNRVFRLFGSGFGPILFKSDPNSVYNSFHLLHFFVRTVLNVLKINLML